eukprot:2431854-Lingulodinium_polyedra.AAC.1
MSRVSGRSGYVPGCANACPGHSTMRPVIFCSGVLRTRSQGIRRGLFRVVHKYSQGIRKAFRQGFSGFCERP